jgi:hypothetical protein
MKHVVCVLVMISTCIVCRSQKEITASGIDSNSKLDSLQKYSYLLVQTQNSHNAIGYFSNNRSVGIATGFFIRTNARLFFITNYHVMTGVDVYNKALYQQQFDTIKIRYFDNENNVQYYSIDLNPIKRNCAVVSLLEYPDLYIYEIKDFPTDAKIFSIEKFLYHNEKTSPERRIAFSYQFSHGESYIELQIIALRLKSFFQPNRFANQISSPSFLSNHSADTIISLEISKKLTVLNSDNSSPFQSKLTLAFVKSLT